MADGLTFEQARGRKEPRSLTFDEATSLTPQQLQGLGVGEEQLQPRSLPELTGGAVTRGTFEAGGGIPGGIAGALVTGGITPLSPATALAGGAIGSAGGSLAFDTTEDILRRLGVISGETPPIGDQIGQASESARMDALFGSAGELARPVLMGRRGLARMFGLRGDPSKRLIQQAQDSGLTIDTEPGRLRAIQEAIFGAKIGPDGNAIIGSTTPAVGAIDVGNKVPRAFHRVIGIFPFVGGPQRNAFTAKQRVVEERVDSLLNELAPTSTLASDIGVNMADAARGTATQFREIAGRLFDNFADLAKDVKRVDTGGADIVPTSKIGAAVRAELGEEALESITLTTGEKLKSPVVNDMLKFAADLRDLPETVSVKQYRGLMKDLGRIMDENPENGLTMTLGARFKAALEDDLANIRIDLLPPEVGEQVRGALSAANQFFSKGLMTFQGKDVIGEVSEDFLRRVGDRGIDLFQSPEARKFVRTDRNIFRQGAVRPGTLNEDELLNAAVNLKSPQAIQSLRSLVGDDVMAAVVRKRLENAAELSFEPLQQGNLSIPVFDGERFLRELGATGKQGLRQIEGLDELLKGTGISIDQLENFVNVTSRMELPGDASQFVARRATLGGLAAVTALAGVGGAAGGAAGAGAGLVSSAAIATLSRHMSRIISDPMKLRLMTAALDQQLGQGLRQQALARVVRAIDAEQSLPEAPDRDPVVLTPTQEI